MCLREQTHTWTYTTHNTITRASLCSRSSAKKSPAFGTGNVSECSLLSQVGRVRQTEPCSWSLEKYMYRRFYGNMLILYRPILSGPNFNYRPINNYIPLSSVRPPGENKEVPQIGIRRNRKPEIYAQFCMAITCQTEKETGEQRYCYSLLNRLWADGRVDETCWEAGGEVWHEKFWISPILQ